MRVAVLASATLALLVAVGLAAATPGAASWEGSGETAEARGLSDVVDPGGDEASTETAQTPTQPGWLSLLVAVPLVGGLAVAAWTLTPSREEDPAQAADGAPSGAPSPEPPMQGPSEGPGTATLEPHEPPSTGDEEEMPPSETAETPEARDASELPTGGDLPGPDDVSDAEPGVPRILRLGKEAVDEGDLQDAVEWFETAIAADPDLAVAHVCRGLSLEEMGEHGEAADAFRSAAEADPGHAAARYLLARNLALSGEPREALVHLRQVLTLVPELTEVAQDDDFGPLQDDPRFLAVLGEL